jgi:pyrophosphatase PpaX
VRSYQYFLFDWDGCLARTLDIVLDTYKETFAEYAIFPSDEDITQKVFGSWEAPVLFGVKDIDGFTKKFLHRLENNYEKVSLYDHAKEVLGFYKEKGKKIGLVTTSKLRTIASALKRLEVQDFFDIVLTAEDVEKHKPDPEIIIKAMERFNGSLEDAIIIGDSKSDLGAALNAKISSVLFHPETNERFYHLEKLKEYHPTFIIRDFSELPQIVS